MSEHGPTESMIKNTLSPASGAGCDLKIHSQIELYPGLFSVNSVNIRKSENEINHTGFQVVGRERVQHLKTVDMRSDPRT